MRRRLLPAVSRRERWRRAWNDHFETHGRERQFVGTAGFLLAFSTARAVTHAIKAGVGPFHNIGGKGGTHIHHMTFGIVGDLLVGYLWMLQVAVHEHPSPWGSRATSFLWGAGAALTLDEFALWLNLEDDYWTDKGRESIDAVVIFGSLLALSALGGGVVQRYVKRIEEDRRGRLRGRVAAAARQRRRDARQLLAG